MEILLKTELAIFLFNPFRGVLLRSSKARLSEHKLKKQSRNFDYRKRLFC